MDKTALEAQLADLFRQYGEAIMYATRLQNKITQLQSDIVLTEQKLKEIENGKGC